MDEVARNTRFKLFEFYLARCRPPTIRELAESTRYTEEVVNSSLRRLHDLHHIALYIGDVSSPTPIAMAHPFSHIPTPYVVIQGDKSWYANCAWCAFGLAAMLAPAEVTISLLTHLGENLRFKFANDRVVGVSRGSGEQQPIENFRVIFSPPPSTWWNDVRFACSTIQICTSSDEADRWHTTHGFHKGEVMDIETLWKLSQAWYGNKHHYQYDRKSAVEVDALFKELGMTSAYWSM